MTPPLETKLIEEFEKKVPLVGTLGERDYEEGKAWLLHAFAEVRKDADTIGTRESE